MNPKKFQIFVSSTYKDLSEIRTSVMQSIQKLLHFPVGMEQFSADDDEQWQIIEETIQQTDYYICIIGHRYGSLSKDGRSFTEKEWDYAKELGIPIMSFIQNRNAKTAPADRESDPVLIEKLDKFISKATDSKMVDFWNDAPDLNAMVLTALYKAFARKPRPGWIRSNSEEVAEALAKLSNENRVLVDKLERLTSKAAHNSPALIILINNEEKLTLTYPSDEQLSLNTAPNPNSIDWHSLPDELKPFITAQEAEAYNRALPSQSEINEKQRLINFHERLDQTKAEISIKIVNSGKAKARQIYIDIKFPDAVLLLDKYEYEKLTPPKHELPSNPLSKARERLQMSKEPRSIFDAYGHTDFARIIGIDNNISHLRLDELLTPAARGRSCELNDNKISMWLDNLMHTRETSFGSFIIMPKRAGNFEIIGTVICEEMNESVTFKIPLVIT